MTIFLQHSAGYFGNGTASRGAIIPDSPMSSAVSKQDHEFRNAGKEEMWNLLTMEQGRNSGQYRPLQNPNETERRILALNIKKQKVAFVLNLSFKYHLWSFSQAMLFTSDRSLVFGKDIHILKILYLGLVRAETV